MEETWLGEGTAIHNYDDNGDCDDDGDGDCDDYGDDCCDDDDNDDCDDDGDGDCDDDGDGDCDDDGEFGQVANAHLVRRRHRQPSAIHAHPSHRRLKISLV